MTIFGGSPCAPIADRTSERTTTIRTNDVIITTMNGTIAMAVSAVSVSSGNVAPFAPGFIAGSAGLRRERRDAKSEPAVDRDDLAVRDQPAVRA